MNTYQYRRKKPIEVNESRAVIPNLLTIKVDYFLFPECPTCGYGYQSSLLKSREPPFEYLPFKTCMFRRIGGEVSSEEVV